MNGKIFNTSIVNIEELKKFTFTIPTYQRPYVWGSEEIKKLLMDFYRSFHNNKEADFYIGTILIKENGGKAELIDGQQRFTTLWLTAFVMSRKNTSSLLEGFMTNDDTTLKINFEIRTEVESYFNSLLEKDENDDIKMIESSEIETKPYLINIAKALVTINGIIETIPGNELKSFGDYIYTKVKFIKNTTPLKIDLNKLFSTINSAGVQLEQTDIVKANLLSCIDEKIMYSKIWEACENTNNFFERNARDSFPKTDWAKVDLCKCNEFNKTIFLFEDPETESESEIFTIDGLTSNDCELYNESKKEQQDETRDSEEVFCRSIINFGQLLLHTYRLHLKKEGMHDFEGSFHVNRLIEIFKSLEQRNDPPEIKRFFMLLWKVRYLFDKYIVKWVSDIDTKTEQLELVNINKNSSNYYTRTRYTKSSMLMLQSVMYFTGDYLRQFWLTSYLGYLLDNHNDLAANSDILLNQLEKIDNGLSLCDTLIDKDASLALIDSKVKQTFDYNTYLVSRNGTSFQHYWFQKLEYILWKSWTGEKTKEFENYRIVSRNSVEHIYPQNPENLVKHPKIEDNFLHCFGNLVLLSVSQNSEYSNRSVDEKRSMFFNKNNTYDTLKSYDIFNSYKNWTPIEIEEHQKRMIDKINQHYQMTRDNGRDKGYK